MLIPSVRKIHSQNSHKAIGLSNSHKKGQQIPYENMLEVDWLLQLQHQAIAANGIANRPWYFLKCHKKYNNRGGA